MATSFYPLSFSVCAPLCINTREKIFKCFVCMSENRSAAACFLVTCFLRPQDTFVDFEHRPVAMCGQKHKKKKKRIWRWKKVSETIDYFSLKWAEEMGDSEAGIWRGHCSRHDCNSHLFFLFAFVPLVISWRFIMSLLPCIKTKAK